MWQDAFAKARYLNPGPILHTDGRIKKNYQTENICWFSNFFLVFHERQSTRLRLVDYLLKLGLVVLLLRCPDTVLKVKIKDLPKLHETLTWKKYKSRYSGISIGVACFTFVLSKVVHLDIKYKPCFTVPFLACADMSPRNIWSRCPRYITVQSDISTFCYVSVILQGFNWWRDYKHKMTEISNGPFLDCIINALSLSEMRLQGIVIVAFFKTNIQSKMIKIPCRRVSYGELTCLSLFMTKKSRETSKSLTGDSGVSEDVATSCLQTWKHDTHANHNWQWSWKWLPPYDALTETLSLYFRVYQWLLTVEHSNITKAIIQWKIDNFKNTLTWKTREAKPPEFLQYTGWRSSGTCLPPNSQRSN